MATANLNYIQQNNRELLLLFTALAASHCCCQSILLPAIAAARYCCCPLLLLLAAVAANCSCCQMASRVSVVACCRSACSTCCLLIEGWFGQATFISQHTRITIRSTLLCLTPRIQSTYVLLQYTQQLTRTDAERERGRGTQMLVYKSQILS